MKIKYIVAVAGAVALAALPFAAQADDYTGTNGPDFIDTIDSINTADNVNAKAGPDVVLTHNNSDNVFAGRGNDEVRTGKGDDGLQDYDAVSGAVNGYFGDDKLYLGPGNDVAVGGEGNDLVSGNGGDDTVQGNFGADTLRGGGGNDSLTPGGNRDEVFAGDNNDLITVNDDNAKDNLQCGDGADEVHYTSDHVDPKDEIGDCELVTVTPPSV